MHVRLVSTAAVPRALREHLRRLGLDPSAPEPDVAIATDWRAAARLFDIEAPRRALYVASLEHRALAPSDPNRIAAALAYDLPLDYLVEREEVAAELRELRPDARIEVVVPGVDVSVEEPPEHEGPLRIRFPNPAGGAGSDGGDTGRAVAEAMREPHEVVAREAHVLVDLAPDPDVLAAFAAGETAIVVAERPPVAHRGTALVADPDDAAGIARLLDTLAREPELLAALRASALEAARAWQSRDESARAFGAALERLVADAPPAELRWPSRLMGDAIAQAAQLRSSQDERDEYVRRLEADLAAAHALLEQRQRSLGQDRAYQAAIRMRTVVNRVRPGR